MKQQSIYLNKFKKKVKPSTEIKNLKDRIDKLTMLCRFSGVPHILICFPELVYRCGEKPTPEDIKWAKEKVKEYEKRKK